MEWTVQLLQLQHAHRLPELRSTRTVTALRAARNAGVSHPGGQYLMGIAPGTYRALRASAPSDNSYRWRYSVVSPVTIPDAPTAIHLPMPTLTFSGGCGGGSCQIHVDGRGFIAGQPVRVNLMPISGGSGYYLGQVTADASGVRPPP